MDFFLNKVSQQAVSFAIRTGIVVTSNYALKKCSRYIASLQGQDRKELKRLQDRLETKIRIISPAIDLVEIISARGNTSLESALTLTKALRHDIQELGQRLDNLTTPLPSKKKRSRSKGEVKEVMEDIRNVINRIEEAVPFINLAVTTSGVNISSSLPQSVSPSRLLQASALLNAGDTAYADDPFNPGQIGTPFTLSLYMLFASHTQQENVTAKHLKWQEVISKCRVKLQRVPLFYNDDHGLNSEQRFMRARSKLEEYCYDLTLIEDLDDGRVHDVEPEPYEDVKQAGMTARIPIHQISKMFYTTSGRILGIEDSNSPILLIKRNKNAQIPRRVLQAAQEFPYDTEDEDEEEEYHALDLHEDQDEVDFSATGGAAEDFPPHLDPEWLAFEIWEEPRSNDDASETELDADEDDASSTTLSFPSSSPPEIAPLPQPKALSTRLASLDLAASPATPCNPYPRPRPRQDLTQMKNTLSLLEVLLRLTILQNFQQASHLNVNDELLNLFLSDAAWDGNPDHRTQEREKTRNKIGFDPFGSSPVSHHKDHLRPEMIRAATEPPSGGSGSGSEKGTPHLEGGVRRTIVDRIPDLRLPMSPSSAARDRARVRGTRRQRTEEWTPERQLSGDLLSASSPIRRVN